MRRSLFIGAMTVVVVCAIALLLHRSEDLATVDVIFDTAKGLVAGQSVKVAGSPVGEIEDVQLIATGAGRYRARLRLGVDREFTPFHADASCQILPQGLLSENYVACDPGSADKPPLRADRSGVPTIQVEQTNVPASLQDLLDTLSLPTSQRLSALFSQLGLAAAGRGRDVNGILRRANPALQQTETVLRMVADQRRLLRDSVTETDHILTQLAADDDAVRRFVAGAATVTETTAAQRDDLAAAIRRLPATLNAIETTLPAIEKLTRDGAPVLQNLRGAAPIITSFVDRLQPFSDAARPALQALGEAANTGRSAIEPARPLVASIRRLSASAASVIPSLDRLLADSRDEGAFENFNTFNYGMSTGMATYDAQGHLLTFFLNASPRCIVGSQQPGPEVEPGCSHAYSSPELGRVPQTQAPPLGAGSQARVTSSSVEDLLDYLLK